MHALPEPDWTAGSEDSACTWYLLERLQQRPYPLSELLNGDLGSGVVGQKIPLRAVGLYGRSRRYGGT